MTLAERILEDTKSAQKAAAAERVGTLRLLTAAFQNRAIEKRGTGSSEPLTEEEMTQVLQKEAKKRREAIELYTKGDRADLAKKEQTELALIETYLPKMLTAEEIKMLVKKAQKGGATEFSAVMKAVMAETHGRADGKMVSELVRQSLS
ncbi:MAG TPA: GatB/YqeY domain-containing protein [Candidatus Paceibacterota bacterium]|nr:GatB/YqeY domain-containing protein [Candidatus Paceibacterota bacterium]